MIFKNLQLKNKTFYLAAFFLLILTVAFVMGTAIYTRNTASIIEGIKSMTLGDIIGECSRDSDCSSKGPGFFCNTAGSCEWKPPIGIPKPEFGIEETYRIYDDVANRNPDLTYTENEEGGYYTHYVDNTHPSATNSGNPYGTADKPRRGVPYPLEAGSVVEIHGGPYDGGGRRWIRFYGVATKQMPIFIRGYSDRDKPLFTGYGNSIRIGGKYVIIENLKVEASSMNFHKVFDNHDNISIRNNELFGRSANIAVGRSISSVIYNNYIHNTAVDIKGDTDTPCGSVGIMVGSYSNHAWIVDNHVHDTGSDSFHSGHNGTDIQYVYIGRNDFHHDKENAIDIKQVRDFVISQNKIYGYRDSSSSGADAIRVNDEGVQDNIWIIFNEIYDSDVGIAPYQAHFRPYIVGNIIYDTPNKAINDVYRKWEDKGSTVVHNTFYDTGIAINKAKECSNNVFSFVDTPMVGKCNEHHNILDESLVNMPGFCERINYFEYFTDSAILTNEGAFTSIRVPGVDFESMGIEYNDRISVEHISEVAYNSATCSNGCVSGGSSTKPFCGWQRVGSVSGDKIILKPSVSPFSDSIACPGTTSASGVDIRIWYYPNENRNEFYMDAGFKVSAGDNLEYGYDGVIRAVSQILKNDKSDPEGNMKDRIIFTPPMNKKIEGDISVCNWGGNNNFNRDLSLLDGSSAIDSGVEDEVYDLFYNTFYDNFEALNSLGQLNIRKDFTGTPRPQGSGWDIGAYEHTAGAVVPIPAPVCGNSIVESGEVCDGNSKACTVEEYQGTQQCNNLCTGWESCVTAERCGDDIKNGSEACDGTDLGGQTCETQGFDSGTLTCLPNCKGFNKSQCKKGKLPVCPPGLEKWPASNKFELIYDNKEDVESLTSFKARKANAAEISFRETINLGKFNADGCHIPFNIDRAVTIEERKVRIDTANFPQLNKKARITFFNVDFDSPKIKKDGQLCEEPQCEIIEYNKDDKTLTIEVQGFSEYSVENNDNNEKMDFWKRLWPNILKFILIKK